MINSISAFKVEVPPDKSFEVPVDEPLKVKEKVEVGTQAKVQDDVVLSKDITLIESESSQRTEKKQQEKEILLDSLKTVAEAKGNDYIMRNTDLAFSIDDDSGSFVIKVTDTKTDEVIRQIPSEEFIRVAKKIATLSEELNSVQGLLFESKV